MNGFTWEMHSSLNRTNVLVIGGGVIGVCCAYYLAMAGRDITLAEPQQDGIKLGGSRRGQNGLDTHPGAVNRVLELLQTCTNLSGLKLIFKCTQGTLNLVYLTIDYSLSFTWQGTPPLLGSMPAVATASNEKRGDPSRSWWEKLAFWRCSFPRQYEPPLSCRI